MARTTVTAGAVPHSVAQSAQPAVPQGDDVWVPSVCKMCINACGILVHRVNGVIVKVEGNPDNPHNFGKLCAKGLAGIMSLYDPDRPISCLRRTNPRRGPGHDPGWQPISQEEAFQEVVLRLRRIRDEDPRKLVIVNGIAEVDTSRLVASAFAEAFGTPNYTMGVFFGTHTRVSYLNTGSMHTEPDLDYCRLLLLFGSQKGAITGHDTLKSARAMARARARGMRLVVFDPVCTPMASKADEWVPLIPGTDGIVVMAMLHVLLNELEIMDRVFLAQQTNAPYLVGPDGRYVRDPSSGKPLVWDRSAGRPGAYDDPAMAQPAVTGEFEVRGVPCRPALEMLRQHVRQFTPERAEAASTVPAATIRRLARDFGETAQIDSTITIHGAQMPFRPVCAFPDSRGSTCHGQGLWTGTAIQLMNVVVGAVDVPGGNISTNIIGPMGRPRVAEGPDGMIVFGGGLPGGEQPYPGRRPRPPQTVQLHELFPVGSNPRSMLGMGLLDFPDLIPYQPEVVVLLGSNFLMSGADPQRMAQALEKVPFIVALGSRVDETLECADIVIPVTHFLEQLDFPVNRMEGWVTGKHWYFASRQPVVDAPPGVQEVVDVFIQWADGIGILPEMNEHLNKKLGLSQDQRLLPDRRYSNTEIVERRMKSSFGPDHDLAWFQQHGLVAWERALAERYPRPLVALPRVPLYFPHILDRGQELKEVLDQLGLDWDLSLYQPVPVWKGCWSHRSRQPEQLFAVNYKLPFQTSTTTQNNPWLMELVERHRLALYVTINSQTAKRLGIADGDEVEIVGVNGYAARAVARVSQCVHPDVVAFASCFGHWTRSQPIASGRGVHFNSFIPLTMDGVDMVSGYHDHCALVTVRKVSAN